MQTASKTAKLIIFAIFSINGSRLSWTVFSQTYSLVELVNINLIQILVSYNIRTI